MLATQKVKDMKEKARAELKKQVRESAIDQSRSL